MELSSLDVVGYKSQRVPNSFIAQPTPTSHLGVILPGLRHSVDMADLHYAGRILPEQGPICYEWNTSIIKQIL
jgi:hypothetical protein